MIIHNFNHKSLICYRHREQRRFWRCVAIQLLKEWIAASHAIRTPRNDEKAQITCQRVKNIGKFSLVMLILSILTMLVLANGSTTSGLQQMEILEQAAMIIFPDRQDRYLVELLAQGYGEEERRGNFAKGLGEIIAVSGNAAKVLESSVVQEALARPELYVEQFSYVSKDNNQGKKNIFLRVKFVSAAVTKLLQRTAKHESTSQTIVNAENMTISSTDLAIGKTTAEINKTGEVAKSKRVTEGQDRLILKVFGIANLEQQSQLSKYLKTIDQYVVAVEVVNVNVTDVDVAVEIVGDRDAFIDLLNSQGKLTPNPNAAGLPTGMNLHYKWTTGSSHEQATTINA